MLEQCIRADPRSAKAFVASRRVQAAPLADCQQRVELLRMHGKRAEQLHTMMFDYKIAAIHARLAYVAKHACALPRVIYTYIAAEESLVVAFQC